jgi:alkylation response protein AidB-like acyl-CoA dehydrogenase
VDFEFDEAQEQLRGTVRRFLAEQAPISPYVREQLGTASGTSREVWTGLAHLGVTGLLVPEAAGGSSGGMVDLAVVLEEMGRVVHPGPFPSTAVAAASLLTLVDDETTHEILGRIAVGAVIATAVLPLDGDVATGNVRASGDRITGEVAHVADAPAADLLVVVAETAAGLGVHLVDADAPGLTITAVETVDATRKQGTVLLHDTPARSIGTGHAEAVVAETRDRMIAAAVVDGVGAAEQSLALAVAYAKEREQFGKPIGSFQAVKHLCADMLTRSELARGVVYAAGVTLDGRGVDDPDRMVAAAKITAGDAAKANGKSCIQVHGGMGFTAEVDAHLYLKRAIVLDTWFGSVDDHSESVAQTL